MRPAAGRAHDREAIQPERVGELCHVARRGGDVAARLRGRSAVARAAVGDEPDAAPGGGLDQRRQRGAALRRSVVPHERGRLRTAGVVGAQRAPVGQPQLVPDDHQNGLVVIRKITTTISASVISVHFRTIASAAA